MRAPRFIPSFLDAIEDIECYRPGGYHPISVGDTFDHGRFRILHKLGFGGSSTVWLARDQQEEGDRGRLVTLKAMRADLSSSKLPNEISELAIPRKLRASLPPSESVDFQTVDHHFFVQGPNGSHLFIIFPLAGPSIQAMYDTPGRTIGSRRLRADLARKVAKQTAMMIHHMHCAGIVHGDLTTSNILFRLSPHVIKWSDDEVYAHLGDPETEDVRTRDGQPPGLHAPAMLFEPIQNYRMSDSTLLQESVMVSDFGQSYIVASPPSSYVPGTVLGYQSPEARFERRVGLETDIWALGCAIFEIRAGFALFESFLGSDVDILRQTVETLGRLPDPWWAAFEDRAQWFEEDGRPKSEQDQERAGVLLKARRSSIRAKLLEIGERVDPPSEYEGPMIENPELRLHEEEAGVLEDLLEKMLKYRPEERIRIQDVVRHPWFT
ncbi:kinase-like domain-containing protein [Thelephora terrestris]|uniref:Kinase-like domain-containing protein n=1 Tax=Thelephora terrestris TaxID=56493 RepID=A0A9P6HBH2_9AGAM|nr:kinase-like domain-containing protein [Thelephora terrestris]